MLRADDQVSDFMSSTQGVKCRGRVLVSLPNCQIVSLPIAKNRV